MKVVIVYDYLNQLGGGERVLKVLCDLFPFAPIYTIFYDEERTGGIFAGRKIITSFLDFRLARRRHHGFIPLMPLAIESLKLPAEYDLVISAGASFAKGIRVPPGIPHLHYCFTPIRYIWEPHYIQTLFKLPLKPPPPFYWWDYRAAQKPDKMLAVSRFIAGKIKEYYGRDVEVLYPPCNNFKFASSEEANLETPSYYLAVGRMLFYKHFDLIVRTFNQTGQRLKIVGRGRWENKIRRLIQSSRIEWLGFVSDEKLAELYSGAKALIMPQTEDFGLVAVEANACGLPVIAFKAGGALEIIQEDQNGIFFEKQSPAGLIEAIGRFEKMRFEPALVAETARRFTCQKFRDGLQLQILSLINGYRNQRTTQSRVSDA